MASKKRLVKYPYHAFYGYGWYYPAFCGYYNPDVDDIDYDLDNAQNTQMSYASDYDGGFDGGSMDGGSGDF